MLISDKTKRELIMSSRHHYLQKSESAGIRTQDPQLRRLLLYPAELQNHCFSRLQKYKNFRKLNQKIQIFICISETFDTQ